MAAIFDGSTPASACRSDMHQGWGLVKQLAPVVLLLPSLLFLAIFFLLPTLGLAGYSVLTQSPDGTVGLPATIEHYRHFFETPLYSQVLFTTLRISALTTAAAVLLAYPVALVMSRGTSAIRRLITMIVIAPLIVSVVVRTYGWELIGQFSWTVADRSWRCRKWPDGSVHGGKRRWMEYRSGLERRRAPTGFRFHPSRLGNCAKDEEP